MSYEPAVDRVCEHLPAEGEDYCYAQAHRINAVTFLCKKHAPIAHNS